MIVHIIEQILRPKIEAVPFVERFGGLAQRVTRTVSTTPLVTVVYPVCVVTPENCPPRSEPILTPDDSKRSVCWFEELGEAVARPDARFAKRNVLTWTARIRFVCWLNGHALGEDRHYFKGSPEQAILKACHTRLSNVDLTGDGAGEERGLIKLIITPAATSPKDPAVVFNPYTFRTDQKLFTKPRDFFGITFTVVWTADVLCAPYIPAPPIDCIAPLPFWFGGVMVGHDTTSNGEASNLVDTGIPIEHEGEAKTIWALNYRFGIAPVFTLVQLDLANFQILDFAAYHFDVAGKIVMCDTGYERTGLFPKAAGLLGQAGDDIDKTPATYTPQTVDGVDNVHLNFLLIQKTIIPE